MPESLLRIDIVCVVPQILESVISSSILKRAQDKGLVEIHLHNLHDYATDT
ncbi:MAG: tRNA (guanosine(37)-N1)-methyltransferase TrmD, partial [Ignavibacteria bacterium]